MVTQPYKPHHIYLGSFDCISGNDLTQLLADDCMLGFFKVINLILVPVLNIGTVVGLRVVAIVGSEGTAVNGIEIVIARAIRGGIDLVIAGVSGDNGNEGVMGFLIMVSTVFLFVILRV